MLTGCVLITGTSRGIGLELTRQLLQRSSITPKHIIATCRNPSEADDLMRLRDQHPQTVIIKELDVTQYEKISAFVEDIKPLIVNHGLGCLVNNAGVSPGLTRLTSVTPEQMSDTFNVNVIAPLMLTKALVKELKYPDDCAAVEHFLLKKPLIVNVGSILGSIGENDRGGVYPYRVSKAALHMLTRNLALDLAGSGTNAICVHPGWLRTRMGGEHAPASVEDGVLGIIDNLLLNFSEEKHNGKLFDYLGEKVPW